jgi:phosphatidylserine/phosphatidylglycerophosphate/cardiolipin synthase-like enzyme
MSSALVLTLLLETAAPAQVLRGVPTAPEAGTVVTAVPPAAANPGLYTLSAGPHGLSLTPSALPTLQGITASPATLKPSAVSAQAPLLLPAPAIRTEAPSAALQAQPAAAKEASPAGSPFRRLLTSAAEALSQNPAAQKLFPGLGRLGAQAAGPRADSSMEAQGAEAEALFNKKAFGVPGDIRGSAEAVQVESAKSDPREAARPAKPIRRVRFNGKDFPAVSFRPDVDFEPLLIKAIDAAQKTVYVALHEFRMHGTLRALRRARERGVEVRIIVDHAALFPLRPGRVEGVFFPGRRDVEMQLLLNEGFDMSVLSGLGTFGLQHNRLAVIDGQFASFGSGRWVGDKDVNDHDSAQFTDDAHRVEGLARYWQYLKGLSQPVDKARDHAWPKDAPPPPADDTLPVDFNGTRLPAWVFAPGGTAEEWIVKAIDASQKTLDLAMYTFRSTLIAEALLRAQERGVKIRILFDRGQSGREYMEPYAAWLAFHKIPVKLLAGPEPGEKYAGRSAHQFLVADRKLLQTGSMNWTKNAFKMSFENAQFLTDEKDVSAYPDQFDALFRSRKSERREPPDAEPALPADSALSDELMKPRPQPPKLPAYPQMPAVPEVSFNGQALPAVAVRPQARLAPLLVQAIDASKKTLRIALYEFNLTEVLDALRRAKARGVDVQLILDYSHVFPQGREGAVKPQRKPEIQALIDEGFALTVLKGYGKMGIMHNKFMVADGALVEFGSFNWSDTAEFNHFENMNFSVAKARVEPFEKYWDWMRTLSQPVDEAEDYDWTAAGRGHPPADPAQPIEFNGQSFPTGVFSPNGAVAQVLIRAIDAAKATLEIAMFSFYSQEIAEALLRAKDRGVNVRIVLDASQAKNMKLDDWFAYHDFDVRILAGPDPHGTWMFEKMHNKFMIADGKLLETGSYNYTANADDNNYENVNFIADAAILAFFTAYFQMLHDLGWKVFKPKQPPTSTVPGSEFFESRPEEAV